MTTPLQRAARFPNLSRRTIGLRCNRADRTCRRCSRGRGRERALRRAAQAPATEQFLGTAGHHLLFAYDDDADAGAGVVVGMISDVETTHPDKGTEMFLYELGVAPAARKRGVATELVRALAALAKARGCYGMWVAVDVDNVAALSTYRSAGAQGEAACGVQSWDLTTS